MGEILAFSAWHVCRLTDLTMRQISYWDRTGFFSPAYADESRRAFGRVYSFRDVVGLRAVAQMRKRYKVPLQHLRQVGDYLAKRYDEPWSRLTFYIVGRRVFYQEDEAVLSADKQGQTVLPFAMERIASEVTRAADQMQSRRQQEIGRITRHRYIAENHDVLAGTRIPTQAIWNFNQAGYGDSQILSEYPRLTQDDIKAAIRFEKRRSARSA